MGYREERPDWPNTPRETMADEIDALRAREAVWLKLAKDAAEALQVFTGHDSGANLRHRYGEKWWEPIDELRGKLTVQASATPKQTVDTQAKKLLDACRADIAALEAIQLPQHHQTIAIQELIAGAMPQEEWWDAIQAYADVHARGTVLLNAPSAEQGKGPAADEGSCVDAERWRFYAPQVAFRVGVTFEQMCKEVDDAIASEKAGLPAMVPSKAVMPQQLSNVLDVLRLLRSDLFLQLEPKHGPQAASQYPSIVKADALLDGHSSTSTPTNS
ncbi:hypothetical protein AX279_17585 [Pseudomonas sp. J237]|nr:hypothetical protein [Pseudomonas aeruginosa]OEO24481.1 hypothetical protein AX279_17585 [Pseudomonas sp. J237]CRN68357.1 hypothetical protein PAERUG_P40_Scotland_4_VIM_2_09_12_04151 [Pseudomonas aeruginosa]